MKEIIWKILLFLTGLLPRTLRQQLSKLLFATAAQGDAVKASTDLLTLQERLMWHINAAAIRYGDGVHPKHRLTGYHDFFTSHLSKGERVLDVGCGYGALADSMRKAGATVIGVDFNATSIAQAKERYCDPGVTFIVGDIFEISLADEVETIVMSNVLEHIEDRQKLMRRLTVHLLPRRFLIRVPMFNRNWLVPFRRELGLFYFSDPTHFIEYTDETFREEMEQLGLVVVSTEVKWGELYAEVLPGNEIDPSAGLTKPSLERTLQKERF